MSWIGFKRGLKECLQAENVNGHRPPADVPFGSAAKEAGGGSIGQHQASPAVYRHTQGGLWAAPGSIPQILTNFLKQVVVMELIVGMGEYIVTNQEEDIIRTYALASCVAVTVYSPLRKAAGMIHVVLPSPLETMSSANRPAYFAVTGVPLLINTVCQKYGCSRRELDVQMFGGADSALNQDIFRIGRKNINAVKDTLRSMGLTIKRADLRGHESRTLEMDVKTGAVKISRLPI